VPEDAVPVFGVEDFRRLPLPAGVVHIQPPNGRTLVNVPTNVYVDAEEIVLPTQVLGFPVRVRATPSRFTWRFGDGRTMTTKDSGAPYPRMTTTHTYTRPQTARVALTTVYTGEYSVAGGPFQPIDGTATVESPGAALTVLAAESRLTTGEG
jgi:PKD repeat protein